MTDIPADYVPKYYVMDPETDDILPDGRGLRHGMVVLLENPVRRAEMEAGMTALSRKDKHQARQFNRWCRVTYLKKFEAVVTFIGVYHDGTKMTFVMPLDEPWFYKMDSVDMMLLKGVEADKSWVPKKVPDEKDKPHPDSQRMIDGDPVPDPFSLYQRGVRDLQREELTDMQRDIIWG